MYVGTVDGDTVCAVVTRAAWTGVGRPAIKVEVTVETTGAGVTVVNRKEAQSDALCVLGGCDGRVEVPVTCRAQLSLVIY